MSRQEDRKPRRDSKLDHLPELQVHALCTWLRSGKHPTICAELLKKEFAVSSSPSAVWRFYDNVLWPQIRKERERAIALANNVASVMEKEPGAWDAVLIEQIKQRVFEMGLNPMTKTSDVSNLMHLILKVKDQQLKERDLSLVERRVKVLETKMSDARALVAGAKSKGGLTPEILKQIEEKLNA